MRRYVPCSKNSIPFLAMVSQKLSYVHTRRVTGVMGVIGVTGVMGHRSAGLIVEILSVNLICST